MIGVMPSVELLTCESDIIVIGKLKSVTKIRGNGWDTSFEGVLDLSPEGGGKECEIIKGKLPEKELVFRFYGQEAAASLEKTLADSRPVLLMLRKYEKPVDNGCDGDMQGQYIPTSQRYSCPVSLFPLDEIPTHKTKYRFLCDKHGRILSDDEEVVRIIREWATSPIKNSLPGFYTPERAHIQYTKDEFFNMSSGCILMVPAEEQYREFLLKIADPANKSDKPVRPAPFNLSVFTNNFNTTTDFINANTVVAATQPANEVTYCPGVAKYLWMYPGKETNRVLLELLKDTYETRRRRDDTVEYLYPIREDAIESLKKLNQPIPDVALTRKATKEERVIARYNYWMNRFENVLGGGWKIEVKDGKTKDDEFQTTSVYVTCTKGDVKLEFILIPRLWDKNEWPKAKHLGAFQGSETGRYFFVRGTLSDRLREKIRREMGLYDPDDEK